MEVAVGLIIVGLGSLVVWDSVRLGHTWAAGGPQPGYFPFYIGLLLIVSGLFNAVYALTPASKASGDRPFVSRAQIKSVLWVFIPALLYVIALQYIGLYCASSLFIIGFMMANGGYSFLQTLPYAIITPIVLFFMFEIWFLISLPKGPIESYFGY